MTALELDYVESLVREHYGIRARAERLTGDRDENFRIQVEHGPGYVLKAPSATESSTTADLLPAVLLHLERVASELPVPRIVRSRHGGAQIKFSDCGGEPRVASLCTFLPGKLLMSAVRLPVQRRSCGELLARLGGALRSFEHPAGRREIAWDMAGVPRLASVIRRIPGLPNARFLTGFVAQFSSQVAPRLARLRHQFVHNDFNARNILVDPQDEARVVGIIDFGDAIHTALAADVAVGVTGQLASPETANEAMREFICAYQEVEPLREEELALLDWLVAGRIVLNVVLTAWFRMRQTSGGHFDGFDADYFGWRIDFAQRLVSRQSP
jgi:Ser/Thr protein kinase RdoA (MazF antagonist)